MAVRDHVQGRAGVVIALAGTASLACYALASFRIPLLRYFPGEERISLDLAKMLGPGQEVAAQYLALVLVIFALYGVALFALWRGRGGVSRWLLFGFPVLFVLALIPMYPPTAVDLIHYHASSRTFAVHGENPLTVAPGTFPYPIGYSWAGQPSPYGPLWSLLGAPIGFLAGEHAVAGIMGFKVLAAASLLGCAALVARLVRDALPGRSDLAVLLFAWNPFVLLRVAGNGHNDLVMMGFVLLGILALSRRRFGWAFVALAAGILVKYVVLLLLPLFVIYAWRQLDGVPRRAVVLVQALALFTMAMVVGFLPFWEGFDTFATVREEGAKLITSTAVALSVIVEGGHNEETTRDILLGLRVLFVGGAAVAWWHSRHDLPRFVGASFAVLALYLLLAAGWFRPWYLLWPLALAALRPGSWLTPVFLAMSFFGMFPDLVEQFGRGWPFMDSYVVAVLAPIVVLFGPVALTWTVAYVYAERIARRETGGLGARPSRAGRTSPSG